MLVQCEKGLTSKLSGVKKIGGLFYPWVKKNAVIGEGLSETFEYYRVFKTPENGLGTFSVGIYAYDGEGDTQWAKDESGNLMPNIRLVCTLTADLSGLTKILKAQRTSRGQIFWKVDYKVKIFFGGTALKARLTWYEGVSIHASIHLSLMFGWPFQKILREGPVSVIPNVVY